MMIQGWKAQQAGKVRQSEPTPRVRFVEKHMATRGQGDWIDGMLGQGSQQTLAKAVAKLILSFRGGPKPAPAPRVVAKRMEAVGAEAPKPRGQKGLFRAVLAMGGFIYVMAQVKPWEHLSGIFPQASRAAARPAPRPGQLQAPLPAQPAQPARPQAALGPAPDAKGEAMALWQGPEGRWYEVTLKGELRKAEANGLQKRLDLPRLSGPLARLSQREEGEAQRLEAGRELLGELLPLERDLAPEIETVSISEKEVSLRTHGGTTALLGSEGFRRKQARLSQVLADLSARSRKAREIDMRFEGSAVVRLASR